jgi:hypothetical protein
MNFQLLIPVVNEAVRRVYDRLLCYTSNSVVGLRSWALKGHCHKKSASKSILGDALDLKYEPLTC